MTRRRPLLRMGPYLAGLTVLLLAGLVYSDRSRGEMSALAAMWVVFVGAYLLRHRADTVVAFWRGDDDG